MERLTVVVSTDNDKEKYIELYNNEKIDIVVGYKFYKLLPQVNTKYILFLREGETLFIDNILVLLDKIIEDNSDIIIGKLLEVGNGLVCNKQLFKEESYKTSILNDANILKDYFGCNKILCLENVNKEDFEILNQNNGIEIFLSKQLINSRSISIAPIYVATTEILNQNLKFKNRQLTLTDLQNKISFYEKVDKLLDEKFNQESISYKDKLNSYRLQTTFKTYLYDTLYGDDAYEYSVFSIIGKYVQKLDIEFLMTLPYINKLVYYLVYNNLFEPLKNVIRFEREEGIRLGIYLDEKIYIDYPYFNDKNYNIPLECYDITPDVNLNIKIHQISIREEEFYIKADAYVDYIDLELEESIRKKIIFRSIETGVEKTFSISNRYIGENTFNYGKGIYYYLYAGVEEHINIKTLETGHWDIYIGVEVDGLCREKYIATINNVNSYKELLAETTKMEYMDMERYVDEVVNYSIISDIMYDENGLYIEGFLPIEGQNINRESSFRRDFILKNQVTKEILELTQKDLSQDMLETSKEVELYNGLVIRTYSNFGVQIPIGKIKSGLWQPIIRIRSNVGGTYKDIPLIICEEKRGILKYQEDIIEIENVNGYARINSVTVNNNVVTALKEEINLMRSSMSWKITKPVRYMGQMARKIIRK